MLIHHSWILGGGSPDFYDHPVAARRKFGIEWAWPRLSPQFRAGIDAEVPVTWSEEEKICWYVSRSAPLPSPLCT
jgi:hypothetical protein